MTEMVERVAAAMWERNRAVAAKESIALLPWDEEDEACRDNWRGNAREAMRAMLEPTKPMMEAGEGFVRRWDVEAVYPAMIQAALEQPK